MSDLRQLVELGTAHLPDGLVPDRWQRRLRQVPAALPDIFTIGTFECRLDDDHRVDFQACAARSAGAGARVARWLADHGERDWPSRGHRATASLLRSWIDPASDFGADVSAMWVEVDIDESDDAPFPFPFFTLTPPWARSDPRPPQRTAALVDAGLDALTHGGLDPEIRANVHRCLHALPPEASLLHVAMRPMPGGDVVRLIAGTPWQGIPDLLARLDWPEPVEHVRRVLQRYCRDTLINSIQLDVGRQLAPRFGLEVFFMAPPEDARWRHVFERLVGDEACSRARRDLVCAWPMRDASRERVLRQLLIKVVYAVGQPLRAKAYLPYGLAQDHQPQDRPAPAPGVHR